MILNRVAAVLWGSGSEVERTEVDRVVGGALRAVKCHVDESLLRDIFAADIELDRAVGELDARHECDPVTRGLAQPNALSGAVDERCVAAVEQGQAVPLGKGAEIERDRFRLTGHAGEPGESHHTRKRRGYELT